MLIGLVSDTHIRVSGHHVNLSTLTTEELPRQVKEVFQGVDLILHAGDIYSLPILDELETVAPILASEGDDDPFESTNDRRVKPEHFITIEGVTIWLSHYGVWQESSRREVPDITVYGHTHRTSLERNDGRLRINPGSATFPQYRSVLGTVAFLKIEAGKVEPRIVQLQGDRGTAGTSGIPGRTN